jgi:hypothetical protein
MSRSHLPEPPKNAPELGARSIARSGPGEAGGQPFLDL